MRYISQLLLLTLTSIVCLGQHNTNFTFSCNDGLDLQVRLDFDHHTLRIVERVTRDSFVWSTSFDRLQCRKWIRNRNYFSDTTHRTIKELDPYCADELATQIKGEIDTAEKLAAVKPAPEPAPAPKTSKILSTIHIRKEKININPNFADTSPVHPQVIPIILIRDSAAPAKEDPLSVQFTIYSQEFPYKPAIISQNPVVIKRNSWNYDTTITGDTAKQYTRVYLTFNNQHLDSLKDDAMAYIQIVGGDSNAVGIRLTEKGMFARSPNFFVGSFIKSISGSAIPKSELLDILLKINLRRGTLENKRLLFSMMGADVGINTTDTAKAFALNEAVLNLNWSFNRMRMDTKRLGYLGGGLKVFNGEAYLGGHIGLLELNGILQNSYILAGYYYSPWIKGVQDTLYQNRDTLYHFRQNFYIEAAFNAFGENAPKVLQFLRLKFGLMLPIASGRKRDDGIHGDNVMPTSKYFQYRLSVEVPIGGPIKF